MGSAYQKAFIRQRCAVLKRIRSMLDLLEFPLGQNLTSTSIAWIVIKVIRTHYLNQIRTAFQKLSGLFYAKLKNASTKKVMIVQYAISREWLLLKWIGKIPKHKKWAGYCVPTFETNLLLIWFMFNLNNFNIILSF